MKQYQSIQDQFMKSLITGALIGALFLPMQSFAQYRFNYSLNGSIFKSTAQTSDGSYRCDQDYMGYYGQCINGVLLGDDGGGTPVTGTCSKGSYIAHYPGDDSETWSGQCTISESLGPVDRTKETYSCMIQDINLNPIQGQCTNGEFLAHDLNDRPITGYCKFRSYTIKDADLNVMFGSCR